jgi:hypothetical protein
VCSSDLAGLKLNEAFAAWYRDDKWRLNLPEAQSSDVPEPKKANSAAPVKEPQEEQNPELCAAFSALLRERAIWGGSRSPDAETFCRSVSSALRNKRSKLSANMPIFDGLYRGALSPLAGGNLRPEAKYLIDRLDLNKDGELTRLMPAYFSARPQDAGNASPTGGAPTP